MNKWIIVVVILIFGFIGVGLWLMPGSKDQIKIAIPSSQSPSQVSSLQFQKPKKSAHYESNTPAHGTILAGAPINIVIDFNFDLARGSTISISSDGKEYGVGETIIDSNQLSMRRDLDPKIPNGVFTVLYKACWADGSCHDGNFQFAIDKSKSLDFVDMRNKKEVTIRLKNTMFDIQNLRISPGTKVVWINEDDFIHTVNTDSHPAHTYFTNQNSRSLGKGDTYSVTFERVGIYPYHCTPHATTMTGSILVE